MTTEIAILNKSAAALAADSAVTITVTGAQGNTYKVLNSANKLFALSKYAPVGLMIYGNASMLGIPWETIVKMYRNRLGDKEFQKLSDYCSDFFMFLDNFGIPKEVENQYIEQCAAVSFQKIRSNLDKWVEAEIASKRNISPSQIEARGKEIIKASYDEYMGLGEKSVFSKAERDSLQEKYRLVIEGVAKKVFENNHLTEELQACLVTIAVNVASVGFMNQSGIVIAGFGMDDLYPSCHDFDVTAVFGGKTIKRDKTCRSITHNMGAAIIPFAQSDDVITFMQGIGPELEKFLRDTFSNIMTDGLPKKLCDEIAVKLNLNNQQKADILKITRDMCKGTFDHAFQELGKLQKSNYIEPVMKATGFLNKGELATMAEMLVNLVSFRKQVSMEAETVGGPIDVAIISKGDGLVWIKKKHYFPAELNHHFFNNYYRKVRHEEQQQEE